MTDLELIAIFAGSWIAAAAIWMLLDWAARPKHARFRPKGDRIQRGPFSYRHFRRVRRAEENEEIRLRIEERYGRPSLALRKKRRSLVLARHDRIVTGIAVDAPDPGLAPALTGELAFAGGAAETAADQPGESSDPTSEPVYWTELRDRSMGFATENSERLANGEAPTRYNPVLKEDETMTYDGVAASWPSLTVDPFAADSTNDSAPNDDALSDSAPNDDARNDEAALNNEDADDTTDAALGRAVRDLEHLPEAG